MKSPFLFFALINVQFFAVAVSNSDEAKHLFILSGQSNMQGLHPEESFTPAVEQAFGKANVIVVKDAQGGQPIRRWYKNWKSRETTKTAEKPHGDLYDRLMKKVKDSAKDQEIKSVTFVWMQGERDAREKNGEVYAECLVGLRNQICRDLEQQKINFVIGRLSDFDMTDKRYPHWTKIRQVQTEFAKNNPRTAWVNTDDLNDGKNRQGKEIENDLHYSAEGYKILGTRFAEEAINLIRSDRD